MTVPASLLPTGIDKTLRSIHLELWERLQNHGWGLHQGIPSPARLGKEAVQVWLAPTGMFDDEARSSLNSESYVSRWAVHIIRLETAHERTDTDYLELYHDTGKVIQAILGTVTDAGLNGAADWAVVSPIEFFEPEPAAGGSDDQVVGALLTVEAHHSLQPIRCE